MMTTGQGFVLRCGALYLGYKRASRVASVDRAVKFSSKAAAERCASEMKGDGLFSMPWQVVSAQEGQQV